MYHSNSSAVPGHELPSEAECSHDWRGVIDWKNSSCWWNQGEDYCGKSSSLISVLHPQESPGLGSLGTGTARGVAPWTERGRFHSMHRLEKSGGEHEDLGCVSGCEERDGTPGFVPGPSSISSPLAELKVTDSFSWLSELSALSE